MPRFIWLAVIVCSVGCAREPVPEAVWPTTPNPAPLVPVTDPLADLTDKLREHPKSPEANLAIALVESTLEKALSIPDGYGLLYGVGGLYIKADPVRGCERLRLISAQLQKLKLPPRERAIWETWAWKVAPHDPQLRNEFLRLAVEEGKRALETESLWKAPPMAAVKGEAAETMCADEIGPGVEQDRLNSSRLGLTLSVRLWELVPMWDCDREAALALLAHLLADAKVWGGYGGCGGRMFEEDIHWNLAALNPEILITILAFEELSHRLLVRPLPAPLYRALRWEIRLPRGYAYYLTMFAKARWRTSGYDSFSETLGHAAFEWGDRSDATLEILSQRDFALAWKISMQHPKDRNGELYPRHDLLGYLIERWAWHDPDVALVEAERIPEKYCRQGLIRRVANVWAYKRPEQIDRAVLTLDSSDQRRPRELASQELLWRKQGNPPRDTPATRPQENDRIPIPAGPWVPPADIQKLLDDPAQVETAGGRIYDYVGELRGWPTDRLIEVANHIKSPQWLARTQLVIASQLLYR